MADQGSHATSKLRDKRSSPILRTFLLEPAQSQPPQAPGCQTQPGLQQSLGPGSQAHGGKKRHGRHLGRKRRSCHTTARPSHTGHHSVTPLKLTWPQLPSVHRHLCRKRRVRWLIKMDDDGISAPARHESSQGHLVLGEKGREKILKLQSYE